MIRDIKNELRAYSEPCYDMLYGRYNYREIKTPKLEREGATRLLEGEMK